MSIVRLIIFCVCAAQFSACKFASKAERRALELEQQAEVSSLSTDYQAPKVIGTLINQSINESSGIVASRTRPGYYWTHNDSGDGPFLYAFDSTGKSAGVWKVKGATAVDWEDIAAGPAPRLAHHPGAYIYIGDIGDNNHNRAHVTVYRVSEPVIRAANAVVSKADALVTETASAIQLRYPDGSHDAEALLVHPLNGDIYIISKEPGGPAGVYRLAANAAAQAIATAQTATLEKVATIGVPGMLTGLITGGDISPDGERLVLCDYFAAYEFKLPRDAKLDFESIFAQAPFKVDLGQRKQGESVCYSLAGNAILATSEKRPTPLIEVRHK